jgi:hypothetical protein
MTLGLSGFRWANLSGATGSVRVLNIRHIISDSIPQCFEQHFSIEGSSIPSRLARRASRPARISASSFRARSSSSLSRLSPNSRIRIRKSLTSSPLPSILSRVWQLRKGCCSKLNGDGVSTSGGGLCPGVNPSNAASTNNRHEKNTTNNTTAKTLKTRSRESANRK